MHLPALCVLLGVDSTPRRINLSQASEEDLLDLSRTCDAATFGRNQEDVLDESYRKAGKLDSTDFATFFDPVRSGLVEIIRGNLLEGHDDSKPVYAELYKLNVYGKPLPSSTLLSFTDTTPGEGSFFKPHKDTPRGENMFGSLVVTFPTSHTGGELVLRHDEKEWTFDPASALQSLPDPSIGYIAFFSDVEHEVLPVKSGNRVTITYNLYFDDKPLNPVLTVNPVSDSEAHFKATLTQLLESPTFLPEGGSLGFGLVHQYPLGDKGTAESLRSFLKGSDAIVMKVCKDLNLPIRLTMLYESSSGAVLLNRPVNVGAGEVEDMSRELQKIGAIIVKDTYRASEESVSWVTSPCKLNQKKSAFLAYGNQAQLDYLYCDLVQIVRVGGTGDRSNV